MNKLHYVLCIIVLDFKCVCAFLNAQYSILIHLNMSIVAPITTGQGLNLKMSEDDLTGIFTEMSLMCNVTVTL